jgi:hypothetical protein
MRIRHTLAYIAFLSYLQLCVGPPIWALPNEGQVVGGSAAISQPTAQTVHIHQSTDRAIINWWV